MVYVSEAVQVSGGNETVVVGSCLETRMAASTSVNWVLLYGIH